MSNKLIFQNGSACVIRNRFLSVCLKWLSILVILICGLFAYMIVSKLLEWWRFLAIPIAVIFAIYYTIGYAKVGNDTSEIVLQITPDVLVQPEMNIRIPVNCIATVTDKSFYYDFDGNGPSNKGWHHEIDIEYFTDNERKTFHLTGLGLSHEDHQRVVNYLENTLSVRRNS